MAARMSGTPGENRSSGLDPVSRRTLSGWLLRAGVLLAFAVLPWCLGVRSLHAMGGDAAFAFSLGGVVAMVTATCHRERVGGGSLNHWDQALAFNGLSLLLHILLRWS